MAVIQTKGLPKRYGDKWVVEQGDIYGFIGRNGAGKPTALKLLCGLALRIGGSALTIKLTFSSRLPSGGSDGSFSAPVEPTERTSK